jgi:hypothetical protein
MSTDKYELNHRGTEAIPARVGLYASVVASDFFLSVFICVHLWLILL